MTPSTVDALAYTPLYEVHRRLGAQFTEFAGWAMPLRYGSEVAEHRAVRIAAGLFDLSHMGEIDVSGPEAAAALDRALVSKPSAMRSGQARYSMICAEDGGILDDLVVYRLHEQQFLVVANASNVASVFAALVDRAAGFDAIVTDATAEWALIAIQGPAASSILARTTEIDLEPLKYYTVETGQVLEADVLLARTGYTGEDGFEIYCRPDDAEMVWEGLANAGSEDGLVPAGLACRDTLRLEAGMPLYGQELGMGVTPFEAGLGRVVNFTKDGGFVGEQALAARLEEGPRSVLVGLASDGRRSPRHRCPVLDPTTGQQVGTVTSGAPSPTLGHPVAIAAVDPAFGEPGTHLAVDVRGTHEPVRVVPMPFYRRNTN
jgi:aminomethyltransferase